MVIIDVVSATMFAALRVYALFDRNRILFTLVLISGLLNPAIMIVRCIFTLLPVTPQHQILVHIHKINPGSSHRVPRMFIESCGQLLYL